MNRYRWRQILMRIAPLLYGWTATAAPAGRAVVKNESLPVYSKMDTASEVVKTLERGAVVVVETSISGENGAWCRVREESQTTSLGYVQCELLAREEAPKPAIVVPQSPQPSQHGAPGGDERIVESTYMRNAWNFAGVLNFTPDQRARLPELAERAGVTQCIQEMEAAYRRHGLPTTKSGADKLTMDDLKRLQPNQLAMARELMPSRQRCDLSELSLSEQVLDLATPEQRVNYAFQLKTFRDILTAKRAAILAGR